MPYESLLNEAAQLRISTYEKPMPHTTKGLYADKVIWINKNLPTSREKACILAEELGHYHTSYGDITDQTNLVNRKQEIRARRWGYKKLVPISGIVQAHKSGVSDRYELAEYLNVTDEHLNKAIEYYQQKYGLYVNYENYYIRLDPLGILEQFE